MESFRRLNFRRWKCFAGGNFSSVKMFRRWKFRHLAKFSSLSTGEIFTDRYFIRKYNIDPPVINGDQMPLHRNESSEQKPLSFKNQNVFVKENHMLSRERITCFTSVGTRTKINASPNIYYQWSPSGSSRLEHLKKTISKLPTRYNMFSENEFAIYVLDDYAVHLMPEVRRALYDRGYVLVAMGGGITGDLQVNDTHTHRALKRH